MANKLEKIEKKTHENDGVEKTTPRNIEKLFETLGSGAAAGIGLGSVGAMAVGSLGIFSGAVAGMIGGGLIAAVFDEISKRYSEKQNSKNLQDKRR